MTPHKWCELTLVSDIDLPELQRASSPHDAERAWRVRLARGRAPRDPGRQWFHHWCFPDGRRWLSFARDASGHLLRFPRLADFAVCSDRREIRCYRRESTPLGTLRHLLLDQVLPLVVGSADRLALHASVVAIGGGAVAFLGSAGRGKSTLAAALTRRGSKLMSDDCCLVRPSATGFEAVPSYPGVRLWPESIKHLFDTGVAPFDRVTNYSSKRRVASGTGGLMFYERPLPLRRLYMLAPSSHLEPRDTAMAIDVRSPREGLLDLVASTFHLDVQQPSRVRDAFLLAVDIARRHRVRRLRFPWDLARTDALADAVLRDLRR